MMNPRDNLLSRFNGVKPCGNGWMARCPAHDDQNPSLSIAEGQDGRVLVHCHAGCETDRVLAAAGLEKRHLFPADHDTNPYRPAGGIVAEYDYRDEKGDLLYQTVRMNPKDFRQRRPGGNGGYIWKLNGIRRVPYRLPELLKANPAKPVLVVEGEKDVDRLKSDGFVATCNAGGAEKWSPELSPHLKGRDVVLVPDNDEPGRRHCEKVAQSLTGFAESVRVLKLPNLPEKGDVSDWLENGGTPEELRTLIDAAPQWEPSEKLQAVNEDDTDPYRLARVCLQQLPILRYWRQEWYEFEGPAYRLYSDNEIRAEILGVIKNEFDCVNRKAIEQAQASGRPAPTAHKITKSLVANVVQALESMTIVSNRTEQPVWLDGDEPFPADECLVTKSTVVWVPGMMAGKPYSREPTPKLFTTNAVDYDFELDADCPTWRAFLDSLWFNDPELIHTLQEIMGYLLLPNTSLQKMFMLIGPRRSGKGTIGRIIRNLVGPDNCCAPGLGSLQNEFGLQPLLGTTVAVIGDARISGRSDESVIVERLLSITGEDAQTVNRKHRETVTTQLKTRFVLISNELPRLKDASATLPSRVILLRMTNSFYGCEDHGLTDKILAELPGILQWSLLGYQRLMARGYFVQPELSRELLDEMEELSSPATAFVNERCEVGQGFQIPVKVLFGAWTAWCEDKGRKPGNEQTFGRDLRAAVPSIRGTQPRIEKKQTRCYEGIKLADTW